MLKKVIAAVTSVAMAALACASMTLSAFADNSVVTTANFEAEVETTTAAEVETSTEATTITTEATDAAYVESTIREDETPVRVRDVVYFEDGALLIDAEGGTLRTGMCERFYIVDMDDANQLFRVYLPKANRVLYLSFADSVNAIIDSHDGMVVGDLDDNGSVNSYDLVRAKRGLINGWEDLHEFFMADMNADGDVTMADIVRMQRWLLGDA